MGEGLAFFLILLLLFAAPLVPLAIRTTRRAIAGWADLAVVAGLLALLLYVTWPVYRAGFGLLAPVVAPILPAGVEEGAQLIMVTGAGAWLLGMFCLASGLLARFKHRRQRWR